MLRQETEIVQVLFSSLILFLPAQMKNPRLIEMYFGSKAAISLPALRIVSIRRRKSVRTGYIRDRILKNGREDSRINEC